MITSLSNDIGTINGALSGVQVDLNNLTNRFTEHEEHIEITEDMWQLHTYWKRQGVTVATREATANSTSSYCTVDPIRVTPGTKLYFHIYCGASNLQRCALFVKEDFTIIEGAIANPSSTVGAKWLDFEKVVPEEAYYMLITTYDGPYRFALDIYYITGVNIEDPIEELTGVAESLDAQDILNKRFEGLKVAIIGDSISTNANSGNADSNALEMRIQPEDVGQTLRAYITANDVGRSLSLGGYTFTTEDIGTEAEFTPIEADQTYSNGKGQPVGVPDNYNLESVKTWWEVARDALGFIGIPVCWSGSSITSHEGDTTTYKTSYAWHDAQIRKCGIRIPGTMTRTAPDVIIIYRGTNDFSHPPYVKLTDGYFNNKDWEYPVTDEVDDGYGFKEGYSLTIKRLRAAYPTAVIMCCTLPVFKRIGYSKYPTRNGLYTLSQFNQAIREVADFFGCGLIEFDKCGITFENCYSGGYLTDDSAKPVHPSDKGHYVMGQKAIKDLVRYMQDMDVQTPATYTPLNKTMLAVSILQTGAYYPAGYASTKTTKSAASWAITSLIDISQYTGVMYDGLTDVGSAPYSVWFDSNGDPISTFKQKIGELYIEKPSEASYVSFSVINNDTITVYGCTGRPI